MNEFKRVIATFADEPADIDIRGHRLVAQIKDDLIDVELSYSDDESRFLQITENGVRQHARPWLLTRIARLPLLADRILTVLSASDGSPPSPFIPPSGLLSPDLADPINDGSEIPIDNTVECLLARVAKPLPGSTSVIYLTSDAGEGKTTVINKVALSQAAQYKAQKSGPIIVPISLGGKTFLNFDDAVIASVVNRFRFSYFYADGLWQLVRLGAIVPAFDGYEEMLVEGANSEAVTALGNLVQSLESQGVVIVAARKAFFEYASFKSQSRIVDAVREVSASFSRLALRRWTKQQFYEYGRQREVADVDEVYELVKGRLGGNHPILTRAVLVRRLFDMVADGGDRLKLAAALGASPTDYLFNFVDAIVKREANEKWLSTVNGDVREPLLSPEEHHLLLGYIAQEMWLSSSNSLRYEVVDLVVDVFTDGRSKSSRAVKQVKERIRQHALLGLDTGRANSIKFDHDDFQHFYLGERLGSVLLNPESTELRAVLSRNVLPVAALEQAIHRVCRANSGLRRTVVSIQKLNDTETGFSFCRENCGALMVRLLEVDNDRDGPFEVKEMLFPSQALQSRQLEGIKFYRCVFQPTSLKDSQLKSVSFVECEFERLELESKVAHVGVMFEKSHIRALSIPDREESLFSPEEIENEIRRTGASLQSVESRTPQETLAVDERLAATEKFLRGFARATQLDEDMIRKKVGRQGASLFIDNVLPTLIERKIIEEVPWRGRGTQRRFKLGVSLSQLHMALEKSGGVFDSFLDNAAV